jgi:amidase
MKVAEAHMNNTLRSHIRRGLRQLFLAAGALGATFLLSMPHAQAATFDLSTATIEDIQAAMNSGTLTSEKLVQLYLARIAAFDQQGPKLNAVISLNKNALAEAKALDKERRTKGPRSPLHGVVVLAKLNQSDWYGVAPSGGSTLAGQPISPYNATKTTTPPLSGEKFNYTPSVPKGARIPS